VHKFFIGGLSLPSVFTTKKQDRAIRILNRLVIPYVQNS
jgi:hypothetical protein